MHLKEGYYLHNGKYQLLNVIGEGGFSLTYKGLWNTEIRGSLGEIPTQIPICIKEYFFKDYCLRNEKTNFIETNSTNGKIIFDKYKEKIIKEARILSELNHPNVVKVLEVFKQNNTVYIVMEFISGQSLKQELEKSGVFDEEKLIQIIYKIGQALQYIHEKNILHLDIKPNNILMEQNRIPKLIDFGISKRYDLSDQQETSTTIMAASKGYASIEQYDSEGMQVFSPCPDIYSLGATMYYLLTGHVPTESILRSTKGLQNPRELNPNISEKTEKVILKAMSLHAADRYQSVMEMITELEYDPEKDKIHVPGQYDPADDDKTTFLAPLNGNIEQPFDVDEETRLYSESGIENKKKQTKWKNWLIPIFAALFLGASFITYKVNNSSIPTPFLNAEGENSSQIENPNLTNTQQPVEKGDKVKKNEDIPKNSKENDLRQEQYNQFLSSAMLALSKNDFDTAKQNFQKAASIKNSPEIKNYIELCINELNKSEIQKRMDLYVLMMDFGNFVVVKRKSDNLFGAIDKTGKEKIQCKYLSAEPIGENRQFLRKDNLYDVYTPSGELIQEAVSGY